MNRLTIESLKEEILLLTNGIALIWNDKDIYIDPFSKEDIRVYYKGKSYKYKNINDLFIDKIYDNKSLSEIINEVKYA